MQEYVQQIGCAAGFLKRVLNQKPEIAILTGTGLGVGSKLFASTAQIDYRQIPHFPKATAPGHQGCLHQGEMAGHVTIVFQGRLHLYEGHSARAVVFPVRLMQALGVRLLVLTNAAGGLDPKFTPGDIMLITDQINLTGSNPLIGSNHDGWGRRFPSMHQAYDAGLRQLALKQARQADLVLQQGVYAGLSGPSLETPAEVRFLQVIGAQAVGFSTVLEVNTAVHAGMQVLGLSCVTNVHDPAKPEPATLEDIVGVAQRAAPQMMEIIQRVVAAL